MTIRDVPNDVRDSLAAEAGEHGQSLQSYLLSAVNRLARFSHNRTLLAEIEQDLAGGSGVSPDAPQAAEVLRQARGEAGRDGHSSDDRHGAA